MKSILVYVEDINISNEEHTSFYISKISWLILADYIYSAISKIYADFYS